MWNQVSAVLEEAHGILAELQSYNGAGQEIREVSVQPISQYVSVNAAECVCRRVSHMVEPGRVQTEMWEKSISNVFLQPEHKHPLERCGAGPEDQQQTDPPPCPSETHHSTFLYSGNRRCSAVGGS